LRYLFLSVLLLFGVAFSASAKELKLDQLRALQSQMKSSDCLTVDFVQTNHTALRGRNIVRHGKAMFNKPDLFKWMLETPVQEYKIYDGKYFYDYNPTAKSAVRYAPTGSNARALKQVVDLVLNFDSLLKHYDLVRADETGDVVTVELKPKTETDITKVELHLSKKESFISYLKLDFHNKSSLTHEFKNPSRKILPEDTFVLPKGVKTTVAN